MAKTRKASTSKIKSHGNWQPQANDAINLATLRWYALTIDKLLIEIYSTDRSKQPVLQGILNQAVRDLYRHRKSVTLGDDGCPDGQVRCADGLCSPMCAFE